MIELPTKSCEGFLYQVTDKGWWAAAPNASWIVPALRLAVD